MDDHDGIWSRNGQNVEELPDPFAPPPPEDKKGERSSLTLVSDTDTKSPAQGEIAA